jgi:hypothetical protein
VATASVDTTPAGLPVSGSVTVSPVSVTLPVFAT